MILWNLITFVNLIHIFTKSNLPSHDRAQTFLAFLIIQFLSRSRAASHLYTVIPHVCAFSPVSSLFLLFFSSSHKGCRERSSLKSNGSGSRPSLPGRSYRAFPLPAPHLLIYLHSSNPRYSSHSFIYIFKQDIKPIPGRNPITTFCLTSLRTRLNYLMQIFSLQL